MVNCNRADEGWSQPPSRPTRWDQIIRLVPLISAGQLLPVIMEVLAAVTAVAVLFQPRSARLERIAAPRRLRRLTSRWPAPSVARAPALVAPISSFIQRTPSIRMLLARQSRCAYAFQADASSRDSPGNATYQPAHRRLCILLSVYPSISRSSRCSSAGSTHNDADSFKFVPRGGRGTGMRPRGCGHAAEYATSALPSLATEAGLICERGDVYENTREGPGRRSKTTSPPSSLCPHPNTCSNGRLAYGFCARAHRCRCDYFLVAPYHGPSRASSAVRATRSPHRRQA
ncbi:hypothetical protein B0H14DRAFT_3653156 [Mycena olivaceomarginata]|nr:hypothetical protein B0H14DRAFT_3653156 [Mycena olivaceomarginata]